MRAIDQLRQPRGIPWHAVRATSKANICEHVLRCCCRLREAPSEPHRSERRRSPRDRGLCHWLSFRTATGCSPLGAVAAFRATPTCNCRSPRPVSYSTTSPHLASISATTTFGTAASAVNSAPLPASEIAWSEAPSSAGSSTSAPLVASVARTTSPTTTRLTLFRSPVSIASNRLRGGAQR